EPFSAIFVCCACCELALVVGLERDAIGIHRFEIARHFRRIDPGIEIGEVPLRKLASHARRFGGLCLGDRLLGGRFLDGGLLDGGLLGSWLASRVSESSLFKSSFGARSHCVGNLCSTNAAAGGGTKV